MKKISIIILILSVMFAFLACSEETTTWIETTLSTTVTSSSSTTQTTTEAIFVNVDTNALTIVDGETYQLTVTSNDALGLTYSVNEAGIINLSDTGFIEAVNEGFVTITIRSRSDQSVYQEVTVDVRKEIYLYANHLEINLTEEDTHQLVITSNDDVSFEVVNQEILTVDSSGLITAKAEGTTTVIVTSTYDANVSIEITVNVAKLITIDLTKTDYVLVVGDQETLDVTSNDGLTFQSGDSGIVSVDQTGQLTAMGFGTTTVLITSTYDDSVFVEANVTVFKYTEAITISGETMLIKGMSMTYNITSSPVGAYSEVIWSSSDESVLTVDSDGIVTAVGSGSASVIATSVLDAEIIDTLTVEVVNMLLVDETKSSGDTYDYNGLSLNYGAQLFSTIPDALAAAETDTLILVEAGTYDDAIIIDKDGIELSGLTETSIITGSIDLRADDILIHGLIFEGSAKIINSSPIARFVFEENHVQNTTTIDAFIALDQSSDTMIKNNSFQTLTADAISLIDFLGTMTVIEGNSIDNVATAIKIDAETSLNQAAELRIFWNQINDVDLAFDIDMLVGGVEQDIYKVARFNSVTNYVNAAIVNSGSSFDFTLNYWGVSDLDLGKFSNVDSYYLKGHYSEASAMPTKATYDPTLPVIINITNPIDEIMIGETYTFEYEILPYELSDAPVRFITGNPDILTINQSGEITPLSSGDVYIQVRSAIVSSIRTQTDFAVITTPGIEILTTHVRNNVVVGDQFTLSTVLFPYTMVGETAEITSSAPSVASIDGSGLVTALAEGLVTFTATIISTEENVSVDYTIYVHGSLDPDNNLLDYLTTLQVSYSEIHEWTAYGFQYNYYDKRAESVSRYYFDELSINQDKMLPVSYGIRPGELMDPLPDGVTQYNPDNVHWIVIHDTASTATGSNALAHANYLYNNAMLENALWVSWHFSIDDTFIYQHLPENERGYHAGDGSSNPGTNPPYLGGGNRNGIGIEMCINEDGDMYRTWQRNAKLVASLLIKYNLPLSHAAYHNDFSGKDCPNTLRNAGLVPLFEEFILAEHTIQTLYPDAEISLTSNNPEYLDNTGRIIQIPQRAMTVSYTITVTNDGITESRTFYTYLPGTVR